jgi:hypothetical protein
VINEIQMVCGVLQEQKLMELNREQPMETNEIIVISDEERMDTHNVHDTSDNVRCDKIKTRLSLSDDNLTVQQKVIIDNLMEQCGFSRKLICLAFERCDEPGIEDAIRDWCNENERHVEFSDIEERESDCDTETYSHHGDGDEVLPDMNDSGDIVLDEVVEPLKGRPNIQFMEQLLIDENHPVVRKLIDVGFDLEQSLSAAEKFPTDTAKAMEYILKEQEGIIHIDDDEGDGETGIVSRDSDVLQLCDANYSIVIKCAGAEGYLTIIELGMLLKQLSENFKGMCVLNLT